MDIISAITLVIIILQVHYRKNMIANYTEELHPFYVSCRIERLAEQLLSVVYKGGDKTTEMGEEGK